LAKKVIEISVTDFGPPAAPSEDAAEYIVSGKTQVFEKIADVEPAENVLLRETLAEPGRPESVILLALPLVA
jgi:hypothetical protein